MGAGFQFIHFGAFSRKGNKNGQTTDFIFSEAERRPEASLHVPNPSPPEVVFGLAISDVRALHDERASTAKDTMKNGRSRAIRSTQQTLATVIASHPFTVEEARADSRKGAEVAEWERRTVKWLQDEFGSQFVSAIRHTDERYCHLHCYLLPDDPMMKAAGLHPGYVAKAAVIAEGPGPGEDGKALNKRGDRAYRAAMREWQDQYQTQVGAPCGLGRIGPQSRRLTRREWQTEQAQARSLQKTLDRAEAVKGQAKLFIESKKLEAAKITEMALKKLDVATQRLIAANADIERAKEDRYTADVMIAKADRYRGLAGKLRAIWDGLKESSLVNKIRAEFQNEVNFWRLRAREADDKLLNLQRMLYESERREKSAREDALIAQIERDRLKAMLPTTRSGPTPNFDLSPKLEFKPNNGKRVAREN